MAGSTHDALVTGGRWMMGGTAVGRSRAGRGEIVAPAGIAVAVAQSDGRAGGRRALVAPRRAAAAT